jgi:hypothetical protein
MIMSDSGQYPKETELRDVFALEAMKILLTDATKSESIPKEMLKAVAERSYFLANAMMDARLNRTRNV